MPKDVSQPAPDGRIRRPSAKLQALQEDFEQEKTVQERDTRVKAKRREERIRKRDQATKAAQFDPLKIQPLEAPRMTAEVPSIADKAFESRAAGGLARTLPRASMVPPGTLVARRGNIPPPSSLPKAQPQLIPPRHVRIFEPERPENWDAIEIAARKRVRAPTPFTFKQETVEPSLSVGSNKPDRADRDEEEDYGNPPFTQRKRVCHIVLSDDEDLLADETLTQDIKAAAAGDGGKQTKSPSRPKISDYDPDERQVIRTAIEFYHSYLLTDNPFPEPREELDWVKDVFEASRIYNKLLDVELDSGIIKIITARGSHLRGQFKSRAKAFATKSYGFEMGDGAITKTRNRKLVTELKDKSAFAFRELHPRRTGIYRNDIIQLVINDVLFKQKDSEGIKWPEHYDPFPRVAFALTLTAIECAVDEWTTGKREAVHFKEDEYKPIFKQHIKTLKYFDEQTKLQGILPKLLKEVFDNGRSNAGVDDNEQSTGPIAITDDVIEYAIQESYGQAGNGTGQAGNGTGQAGNGTSSPNSEELEEIEEEESGWWLKEDDQVDRVLEDEIEGSDASGDMD